jgi:3-(3-hydroxy-phenyl)propionate hydroxylase
MTPRTHWPVIIVGAGPTGLTLAGLLARYGLEVFVIERNPQTVQEPRAVSIDDESLRTMQSVGVIDQLVPNLVLGYGSEYFSPAGRRFLKVKPTTLEYGYPRRSAFRQPVLEALLRENLARHRNATTWFAAELVAFSQSDASATLRVRKDDAMVELSCDYLVGCDGSRSYVRQGLGIELHGSTFKERWLSSISRTPRTPPGTRKSTATRRGPVSPCPAQTARGDLNSCSMTAKRTPARSRRRMSHRCCGSMAPTTPLRSGARWSTRFTPDRRPMARRQNLPRRRCRASHAAIRGPGHEQRDQRRA